MFLTDSSRIAKSIPFSLAENCLVDRHCNEQYENWTGDDARLIGNATLRRQAKKALRKVPGDGDVPNNLGIYSFKIDTSGPQSELYIGKASSLRQRLRDYGDMTRRLLALYFGHPVWSDSNGFRYVHYRLAQALADGHKVEFEFFELNAASDRRELARRELLEISDAVMKAHVAGANVSAPHILNAFDRFRSETHAGLSKDWFDVQRLLQEDP